MKKHTHSSLVRLAAKWLQSRRCCVVVTEMATTGEEPDALGFQRSSTILVECKATRADFLADRKKPYRRNPERGMGLKRYMLTPAGLVQPDELPVGWGLLEATGSRVFSNYAATPVPFSTRNWQQEQRVLVSCLRRLGIRAQDGIGVQVYTMETGAQKRATLGVRP